MLAEPAIHTASSFSVPPSSSSTVLVVAPITFTRR